MEIDFSKVSEEFKNEFLKYEAFGLLRAEAKHDSNMGVLILDMLNFIGNRIESGHIGKDAKMEDFMEGFIIKEVGDARNWECFGKFGTAEVGGFIKCTKNCGDGRYNCISEQNIVSGECNCLYKVSCSIGRQMLQVRQGNKGNSCWFFRQLKPRYDESVLNDEMEYVDGRWRKKVKQDA